MPFSKGAHAPGKPYDAATSDELVISTGEAASLANLSQRTIVRMCTAGSIKASKFGRQWRIPKADFLRQLGV